MKAKTTKVGPSVIGGPQPTVQSKAAYVQSELKNMNAVIENFLSDPEVILAGLSGKSNYKSAKNKKGDTEITVNLKMTISKRLFKKLS